MKLINQEIWLAYPNLQKLSRQSFPVKAALSIASIMFRLEIPYKAIEYERTKLVNKYGVLDTETQMVNVDTKGTNGAAYAREFAELLMAQWDEDFNFTKIVIPEKVIDTCPKCGEKFEGTVILDTNVIAPLVDKFIECEGKINW